MKIVLLLAFVAAAFATECVTPSASDMASPAEVFPGYRYDYEMDKEGAHGSIYVTLGPEQEGKYLYFKAQPQSTTSEGGSLHTKHTINGAASESDEDWNPDAGTLLTDDVMRVQLNSTIMAGEQHWFTFFPECSSCSSTIEFAIEIAILDSIDPDRYSVVWLRPQMRTLVFKTTEQEYVYFKYTETNQTDIYISVVMDDLVDSKSQVHQYLKLGSWPMANSSDQNYPTVGEIDGDYITQSPFELRTAGDWYLGVVVVKQIAPGNDVDWTIKAGFNELPCAGASGLTLSVFSFVLIPLALFFKH